jgi:hypothetical protein
VMRPRLEVADIFRRHGAAFRAQQGNRLLSGERRVMDAIEMCRTAALGAHVDRCEDCGTLRITYNSCRNRHCPKCQALGRAQWIADRDAELLPVPYFHVVFTVPPLVAAIALQNKATLYDILFKATSDTIRIIGRDPKHLGAETGMVAVLHTWGQTLTYHPHVHCIIPGGGLAADGRWINCRPNFFLPVRVLSRLYRRLFLQYLQSAFHAGKLQLAGTLSALVQSSVFTNYIDSLHHTKWVVYAKRPFADPHRVTKYLGRYTHRVAIANTRLLDCQNDFVRFRWKDYRASNKWKTIALHPFEFIRRFLLHVLPKAFRRIRHFGFLANACRATKLPRIRASLDAPQPPKSLPAGYRQLYAMLTGRQLDQCPLCGGRMIDFTTWPSSPNSPRPSDTS